MNLPKRTKDLGGRPTKFPPDVYEKIDNYLGMCGREQTELPTVEGLALYLGVNKTTIYEWSKKHPGFSNYLEKVANRQKNQLINDGMYGGKEVNAAMAIFLLKAIHRMSEGPSVAVQVNVQPILGGKTVSGSNGDQKAIETKEAD